MNLLSQSLLALLHILNLKNQLKVGVEEKLNASGLDWDYVKENHPSVYKKIFSDSDDKGKSSKGQKTNITPEQARELLRKRGVKGY